MFKAWNTHGTDESEARAYPFAQQPPDAAEAHAEWLRSQGDPTVSYEIRVVKIDGKVRSVRDYTVATALDSMEHAAHSAPPDAAQGPRWLVFDVTAEIEDDAMPTILCPIEGPLTPIVVSDAEIAAAREAPECESVNVARPTGSAA